MKITPLHDWIGSRINHPGETFSRASLEAWQLQRLQSVLGYAREHARFYRDLFASAPQTIHSFNDLAVFPFTTADDLRADPLRFVCLPQDEISRIVTLPTSGTSGPSKRVFFSESDQELTVDFFKVGMSTLARAGDRVLILLPGVRPGSVGDLLRIGLERLGCQPVVYGPVDEEEKVLKVILEQNCNVLVGAPVHLHRLARWDEFHHILPAGQIRALLSSTDVLADTIRGNLQTLWGCEVFDHWGMTETGLGGGVECEAHHGVHLREADLYVEIIDPISGRVLPDGEMGEVVFTTLTRTAMPLIRYRTGDLSRLIPGLCPCGSFIKRLERIRQRVNSGVPLHASLLTLNDLDEALFQIKEILDFSALFRANSGKTELTLYLRLMDGQKFSQIKKEVKRKVIEINPLEDWIENGQFNLKLLTLPDPMQTSSGFMQKRVIQTNN